MLAIAKLLEEPFRRASAEFALRNPERFYWLHDESWAHLRTLEETDWNYRQRLSVVDGSEPRIVGYLSASIDRACDSVSNLAAFALTRRPHREFAIDTAAFVDELRAAFRLVRFSVAVGNPAEAIWSRMAAACGGGPVGTFSQHLRTQDGKLHDMRYYEIPGGAQPILSLRFGRRSARP